MISASTIATGFAYPEGPRWHDNRLWFAEHIVLTGLVDYVDFRSEGGAMVHFARSFHNLAL